MLSRRSCLLLVCLVLSFLTAFFGVSIDASAATIEKMTASEVREQWGDNISCEYTWSGVEYTSTLQYVGTVSMESINILSNDVLASDNLSSYDVIMYSGGSVAGRYGWIRDVEVIFPFHTDNYVRGGFMARVGNNGLTDPVFDNNLIADAPNNTFGSYQALAALSSGSGPILPNYYNLVRGRISGNGGVHTFRSITYLSDSGINSDRVYFDNIQVDYYSSIYFCIICPYYSGDISITAPVETTTTSSSGGGSSGTDVNININMTETNGILGSIRDLIANLGNFIVTGIKNLFIPDEDDLAAFKNTVEQLLRETFGGIPALEEQLEDAVSGLFNVTATTSIHFDGIQFDGNYYVPAQDVNLKPAGYDSLYTFVEMIINILATIAVVNTSINQVKRVLVGEVVVDVD